MSGMLERNFHVLSLILHVYLEVGKGVHFLANFGHFMNNKKFFFFFFFRETNNQKLNGERIEIFRVILS